MQGKQSIPRWGVLLCLDLCNVPVCGELLSHDPVVILYPEM